MSLNTELVKTWLKKSYINFLEIQIIELELEVNAAREQYIKEIRKGGIPNLHVDPSLLMDTLRKIEGKSIEINRDLILARKISPQEFYEALVDFVQGLI